MAPSGAQIKHRYGVSWFGFDRQKQTLNVETSRIWKLGWEL